MKRFSILLFAALAAALAAPALAQQVLPAAARPLTLTDAKADKNGIRRMATLRALDKITGRAVNLLAPAGRPVSFGSLTIVVHYCYTRPPEELPETLAFIQIDEARKDAPEAHLFSGWMFASSPALNALDHPVYDVWVISCSTDEPAKGPPAAEAPKKPSTP